MDSDQFAVSVNFGNKDVLELNALDCIDSLQFKYQVKLKVQFQFSLGWILVQCLYDVS
jgi:hypothetical protein